MKLGLLGARADSRGLAYQTQDYARHLPIHRYLGLDLTADDLSPYPCSWTPYDHLPGEVHRYSQLTENTIRAFLREHDVVIGAETFYHDDVPIWAREENCFTVLVLNAEFAPWWNRLPKHRSAYAKIPKPDVLLAPTTWLLDKMPGVHHLPHPVDRDRFPFQLRTSAKKFVHVAGHRAMADRAGTRIVLAEVRRLQNRAPDIEVVIRTQSDLGFDTPALRDCTVETGFDDPRQLYKDADVLLLPRRYGGNSLVHNEALSLGLPVVSLDRDPENTWGGVTTVAPRTRGHHRTKAGPIVMWDARPGVLTKKVIELHESPAMVEELSRQADEYADTISWKTLGPVYEYLLYGVVHGKDPADLLRRDASPLL